MAKTTIKQSTIDGLQKLGFEIDRNSRSSKYVVFIREGSTFKYLVGKSGALRRTKGAVSKSFSISGGQLHKFVQLMGSDESAFKDVETAKKEIQRVLMGIPKENTRNDN